MTGKPNLQGLGLRRTSIDIALTFGRQFLAAFLQLGILIVLARQLGVAGTGVYAVALLYPTVMGSLLSFGITAANVYFLASKQEDPATIWSVSRDFTAFVAVLGTLAGLGIIAGFSDTIFPGVPPVYLYIALFIFPLNLLTGLLSSIFQALQNFRAFNFLALSQPMITFSGQLIFWFAFEINLIQFFLILLISHILTFAIGLGLLSRSIPILSRRPDWRYLPVALRYGYKAHIGRIATLLVSRSDLFMVNFIMGPAAAGIYVIAIRIVEQLFMVSQAVSTVLFPRLSAMVDSGIAKQRLKIVTVMTSSVFWLTIGASILLSLVVSPVIQLLFGGGFSDAVQPLLILLPGVVLFSASRVVANDFAARNLVHINLILTLITLTLNIIGNVIMIPKMGLSGAALATSIAYGINYFIRLILYTHLFKVRWTQFILIPRDLFRKRTKPEEK